MFLQNDEITTGLINNKTEIKIHLLTGQLSYFNNEQGLAIDLKPPITTEWETNMLVKDKGGKERIDHHVTR